MPCWLAAQQPPEEAPQPVVPAEVAAPPATPPPVVRTESEATLGQAYKDASAPTVLDYLYNNKPKQGSGAGLAGDMGARLADKLKALDTANSFRFDNPAVRGRFDKYLSTKEESQETINAFLDAHRKIVSQLEARETFDAWKGLLELANNPVDGGTSRELANRIESVWNKDRYLKEVTDGVKQLQKNMETAYRSADIYSQNFARDNDSANGGKSAQPKTVPPAQKQGTSGSGTSSAVGDISNAAEGKLRITGEYIKAMEARARIKLAETKADLLDAKSRSDFADYVSTLFVSRKYYHVILAASFYRRMFTEGDYPVAMANQVNTSLQMIREIGDAIQAFRYKVERDEISSASERLQDAFIASETHPAVVGLERSIKERVGEFWRQTVQMQNTIEARDFGALEDLLKVMAKTATDFDPTKARGAVNMAKLESKLHLGKAKLAAQGGNVTQAMEEIRAAAEAWPQNPDIETAALTFFSSQDVVNRSTLEFDQMFARQDYRAIFENQLQFAPAIRGDEKREALLKQALTTARNAELAIEKSNLLVRAGDAMGAWEILDAAVQAWPEDNKLNRLRSDLAIKASDFVSVLNKAQEAEARKEWGYSLSWYVSAQKLYPSSQVANDAIKRLSTTVIDAAN
jgi:hypothetical protein